MNYLFSYVDAEGDLTTVDRHDDGLLVNASSGGAFVPPKQIPNLIDALRSVEDTDWPARDPKAAARRKSAEAAERETGAAPLELRIARILRKHVGRGSYIPGPEAYVCAENIVASARTAIEAEVREQVVAEALAVHPTVKVYRECEHVHTEGDLNAGTAVYVYELGIVCTDGFMYEVCGSCCWVEGYGQTEDCVTNHEDQHREGWLCATHDALKGGGDR